MKYNPQTFAVLESRGVTRDDIAAVFFTLLSTEFALAWGKAEGKARNVYDTS